MSAAPHLALASNERRAEAVSIPTSSTVRLAGVPESGRIPGDWSGQDWAASEGKGGMVGCRSSQLCAKAEGKSKGGAG